MLTFKKQYSMMIIVKGRLKMKRIVLKKWVEVVIIFIQVISFMILGSESDDLKVFIISKLIALIKYEKIKINNINSIYGYVNTKGLCS